MIPFICRITDECLYKTEADAQRANLWLLWGKRQGEGSARSLGLADANYYI